VPHIDTTKTGFSTIAQVMMLASRGVDTSFDVARNGSIAKHIQHISKNRFALTVGNESMEIDDEFFRYVRKCIAVHANQEPYEWQPKDYSWIGMSTNSLMRTFLEEQGTAPITNLIPAGNTTFKARVTAGLMSWIRHRYFV